MTHKTTYNSNVSRRYCCNRSHLNCYVTLVKPVSISGGESIAAKGTSMPAATIMASFIAALGGLYLVSLLRFPTSKFTGPLGIAAILNVSGITTLALPKIFLIIPKIVIVASLGSRLTWLKGKMLVKAMALSLLSVCGMQTIGIIISLSVLHLSKTPFDVLRISFFPRGIIEITLISLTFGQILR